MSCPYSFNVGSVFLTSLDLENMITLIFSGFSLILHLAHHIAKFRMPCCKTLAGKHTFKLKVLLCSIISDDYMFTNDYSFIFV